MKASTWSFPNENLIVKEKPGYKNCRVALMAAICSKNARLEKKFKLQYFNSDDVIKLLKKLLRKHKREKVAVFCDNASYHKAN